MDDRTWDGMLAALDAELLPKIKAKRADPLVHAYRSTFWEILKRVGANTSDFQSCPPHGVCTPDIPIRALDEVVELKARFDRLEQFVIWVSEEEGYIAGFEEFARRRLNDMIDAAKEALDDA
jgi:hypothetical protein